MKPFSMEIDMPLTEKKVAKKKKSFINNFNNIFNYIYYLLDIIYNFLK